jgi:thiamine biosynthesis lipoprotein
VTIRVYAEPSDRLWSAIGEAFDRMKEIRDRLAEDVARLNKAAGDADPVPISADTQRVLLAARDVSAASGGAFDVTWAALADAWKLDAADFNPSATGFSQLVEQRLTKVGWERLTIEPGEGGGGEEADAGAAGGDGEADGRRGGPAADGDEPAMPAGTARLEDRGMRVGLGAIGKGYGVDEAAAVLIRRGFPNFVIDAAGDVYVHGRRGRRDWTVGLRHPRGERGETFAVIPVRDRAVATTGDYERFVVVGGVRYSHLIDPREGRPADKCISATVIHPYAVTADALATAAFVLGPAAGLELVRQFPDAEAVIVDPNLGVHVTRGLERRVTVRWLKETKR